MADEITTTRKTIDDNTKAKAIADLKVEVKTNKRGAIKRVAEKYGINPVTLSEWRDNPRYNKVAKKNTASKLKGKVSAKQTSASNGKQSLREIIASLPEDYDELLLEHIKLLRQSK